jgi:hypothetical protein
MKSHWKVLGENMLESGFPGYEENILSMRSCIKVKELGILPQWFLNTQIIGWR